MAPISKGAAELARVRMCVRQRIANRSSYPLGPVDDPSFPVAIHEAGHAMAAWLEGSAIDSVKISETERGGVSGRMRLHNAHALTCAILMGGMAAEITVLGYAEKECSSTDLYQARDILRSTCSDDRLIEARLERELNQTIALLKTHRGPLLALTGEIIHKRFLTGGDVSRIITKALAGRSLRASGGVQHRKITCPPGQGARLLEGSR